jgi:hypothetical protein
MRKRLWIAAGMLALAFQAAAQQSAPARSLQVKLNYAGSGTVDEKHRIFVFLFDTPDFMQGGGVMPIASGSATAKDGTVTIANIGAATVYAVAAFDPNGAYDGTSGPPPQGSSMGLYSKEAGTPAPVKLEPGKPGQIVLKFDDSMKIQ